MADSVRITVNKIFGIIPVITSIKVTEKLFSKLNAWAKIPFWVLPGIALLSFVPWGFVAGSNLVSDAFRRTNFTISSQALTVLTAPQSAELAKSAQGLTNIMLVGIDTRPNAKGAGLQNTDSIMLVSYNHKTNRVTLLSFPRDLVVKNPQGFGYGKINSVYASAERAHKGNGLKALTKTLNEMTGQPIHYYAMINLDGFRRTINLLGGITVTVERTFVDFAYPTDNYGYMIVRFNAGKQKMNGERALQFSRSRHASGPEGSDFARARRQQKVIEAIIVKFRSTETLQNPLKVYSILKAMINNVQTSAVTPGDVQAAMNLLQEKGDTLKFTSLVLDPYAGNRNLIHVEMGQFGYSLMPNAGMGNWKQVKAYLSKELTKH